MFHWKGKSIILRVTHSSSFSSFGCYHPISHPPARLLYQALVCTVPPLPSRLHGDTRRESHLLWMRQRSL